MTCHEHADVLLDVARGVPVDAAAGQRLSAHVTACVACRARLAQQREMTRGLRALARSRDAHGPSAAMERELMAAFARVHPQAAAVPQPRRRWHGATAAAAAVVLSASVLGSWYVGRTRQAPVQEASAVSEFVPWPGAASLPAFESGELVRTELPASTVPLLGLAPAGFVTGNTVTADVLVGQDGLARAVRLVKF